MENIEIYRHQTDFEFLVFVYKNDVYNVDDITSAFDEYVPFVQTVKGLLEKLISVIYCFCFFFFIIIY